LPSAIRPFRWWCIRRTRTATGSSRLSTSGAIGFIPKSAQREVLLGAFNLIFSGGIYIPPEILDRRQPAPATKAGLPKRKVTAADLGLTERQMEVLALMMQGKSNKAICRVLDLAEPTLKIHVSAVLRAL
jgi:DNA-binding NarL/FixJ family response regulator